MENSCLSGNNVVIATLRISSLCLRAKMKCRKAVVYKLFHCSNYKGIKLNSWYCSISITIFPHC